MYIKSLPHAVAFTIACVFIIVAHSQTIFTYNNKPVSKGEFLNAFNKNPDTTGNRAQKLKDYLTMYINFKLKLQEAYNEKLDTKDEFIEEAKNFKSQLAESYINSQANIAGLVHEAFNRSQKDILLAEVFVSAPGGTDTAPARQKIQAALAALKAGKSFGEVAAGFSTDDDIKSQKGVIGYITVFSLPYELENLVYALKPGEYSTVYHSSIGYHIFKNISERPAAGRRKIQQILLPIGKSFTAEEKQAVAHKADSIYAIVKNGGNFEEQAAKYSNTNLGGRSMGINTIGVGMYSLGFEKAVYALQKPGDISSPFLNEYGYNIIKLLEIIPVNNKEGDVVNQGSLQQLVLGSDRLALARNNLVKQWLVVTKYKKGVYNETDLWKYTDSAIVKHTKAVNAIDSATVLFSFPGKKTTVNDWVNYVKSARLQAASSPKKSYQVLLTDFTRQTCNEYYRNHIEEYNAPIADQMSQFNEANLLFAVMDKHVWGKASLDTVALQQFYTENKKNYTWAPGVSALTITCAKKEIIDSIAQKIKTAPAAWRKITGAYGNVVNADSSRYENGQLPLKQPVPMQAGFASSPEQTQSGDGWIFVYVFNVYPQQSQRSFEDAKGMVINDYQQVLENNWLETLKKKYTVTINEKVVESLK